jgi:hypothetical protein
MVAFNTPVRWDDPLWKRYVDDAHVDFCAEYAHRYAVVR